jgi:hypothetical protein
VPSRVLYSLYKLPVRWQLHLRIPATAQRPREPR